jgi:hypothetical protein
MDWESPDPAQSRYLWALHLATRERAWYTGYAAPRSYIDNYYARPPVWSDDDTKFIPANIASALHAIIYTINDISRHYVNHTAEKKYSFTITQADSSRAPELSGVSVRMWTPGELWSKAAELAGAGDYCLPRADWLGGDLSGLASLYKLIYYALNLLQMTSGGVAMTYNYKHAYARGSMTDSGSGVTDGIPPYGNPPPLPEGWEKYMSPYAGVLFESMALTSSGNRERTYNKAPSVISAVFADLLGWQSEAYAASKSDPEIISSSSGDGNIDIGSYAGEYADGGVDSGASAGSGYMYDFTLGFQRTYSMRNFRAATETEAHLLLVYDSRRDDTVSGGAEIYTILERDMTWTFDDDTVSGLSIGHELAELLPRALTTNPATAMVGYYMGSYWGWRDRDYRERIIGPCPEYGLRGEAHSRAHNIHTRGLITFQRPAFTFAPPA